MRGLEKNRMGRGHIYIYTDRHRDLLTNSAQRAELVKRGFYVCNFSDTLFDQKPSRFQSPTEGKDTQLGLERLGCVVEGEGGRRCRSAG